MVICDQYDALRSRRPYKQPLDHRATMRVLIEGDGRTRPEQFHPDILHAFKRCQEDFSRIFEGNSP
jgi:putative two-component system response regulator